MKTGNFRDFVFSEDWKESLGEQIYEKYTSIVTLEHLLRKDLEVILSSLSESLVKPKVVSNETLQTLPDLLRTKPDQDYLKYLSDNYAFYLQESKLEKKDSEALSLRLVSILRTCSRLLERVEEFLEQDARNKHLLPAVDNEKKERKENSLCWDAYERGVGLS
ncbi:hypothetical protein GAYE_SCF48G5973 [Galdieria yellowstonensis]|uniref:Uncharacterized protein n=1 Tax=Galdieria yellowstonensis TaxID=3028027 RepID=A0AAV9IL84_9RHOD|nr:hypothetical protein GAYE_SCF48G5973 [Galdieria yellowstonensis]